MSENLSNEYNDLIEYLEKQEGITPRTKESKRNISIDTKTLLEECSKKIHADIPLTKAIHSSEGFDVFKFESLMRSKLIDSYKRDQSYDRPYISVTELISCMRKNYYSRMKYPINIEKQYQFSYLYLINQVGNTIHEVIQTLYDHTEVEKTILSERFKVKGRADGIRDNFLLEYKSIDKDKFKNKYIEAHYIQGNIYAHILNVEYNYKIDTVTIVYIIRDLKRVVPFDIPVDFSKAEEYLKRALMLRNCISQKIVPDPVGVDKEQCKWCSYKSYCDEDKAGILQPFKEKVKDARKSIFLL